MTHTEIKEKSEMDLFAYRIRRQCFSDIQVRLKHCDEWMYLKILRQLKSQINAHIKSIEKINNNE